MKPRGEAEANENPRGEAEANENENPLERIRLELCARRDNAIRNSKLHPDLQSRRDASVRAETYEMALDAMKTVLPDPRRFAIVVVQDSDESEDEISICTGGPEGQLLAMPVPLARRLAGAITMACDFSEIQLRGGAASN